MYSILSEDVFQVGLFEVDPVELVAGGGDGRYRLLAHVRGTHMVPFSLDSRRTAPAGTDFGGEE